MKSRYLLLLLLLLISCRKQEPNDDTNTTTPTPTEQSEEVADSLEPTPTISPLPSPANMGPGWEKVSPAGETRCAHDTPFSYWIKLGSPDKLLVYFQGGGGCWDAATCAPGSTLYDEDVTDRDSPVNRSQGIFDLDNPANPFADHTILYIPSCTGDIYWGNNVEEYSSDVTIYHRGFVNAATALEWPYEFVPDPEEVFVTGCSAGSMGSIMFAPYLIEQYPNARVTQLGDSLSFVFPRPVNLQDGYKAHDNFPDWIPALQAIQPGQFVMSDYYIGVANHYSDNTFAQFNTQGDDVQYRYYSAFGGTHDQFLVDLSARLSDIHASAENFRTYTGEGSSHCILPRNDFYSRDTDGVAFSDWITDLANGEPVDNVQCTTCEINYEAVSEEVVEVPTEQMWEEIGQMPTPRSEYRGLALLNRFYLPGGWGGEDTFEMYNPADDLWTSLANLPEGRHHFMVAEQIGLLWLFGGSPANAYSPSDNVWAYSIGSNNWTERTPMPEPRMGGAAVTIGEYIYIVGGETTGASTFATLRYDQVHDEWVELAPMNQHREHTAAVVYEGKIYVAGGWWRGSGELTSMEVYDPETDEWALLPSMSVARGGLALAVLNDQLYAVGGEILSSNRRTESTVEIYDFASQTWSMGPSLPASIHGFALFSHDGALWLIGGSDQAGGENNQGRVLRLVVSDG